MKIVKVKPGAGAHKTGTDSDLVDGHHAEDFLLSNPGDNPNLKKVLNLFWDQDTEELVICIAEDEEHE